MKTLGNILWHFPFFGFVSAAIIYSFGLLFTATVIAAPIGLGLMEFGKFLLAPFGHCMVNKADLNIEQNTAWKAYSTVVMILYLPIGIIFSVVAIFQLIGLCLSVVGIPVALVVAKSLGTYLNPVNKKCVRSSVAAELARRKDQTEIDKYLDNRDSNNILRPSSTSEDGKKQCKNCFEQVSISVPFCINCGTAFPKTTNDELTDCSVTQEDSRSESEKLRSVPGLGIKSGNVAPVISTFASPCEVRLDETILSENAICPTCGIRADKEAVFCRNCGQQLRTSKEAPSQTKRISNSKFTDNAVSTSAPSLRGASDWLKPAIGGAFLAMLAAGGFLYYENTKREAESLRKQQLAEEQARILQIENEARNLAEQVARLEAEKKAQAEQRQLRVELERRQTELEQQKRANAEIQRQRDIKEQQRAEADNQRRTKVSSVTVTLKNIDCFAQDIFIDRSLITTISPNSDSSFTIPAGLHQMYVCRSSTKLCGRTIEVTWPAGKLVDTLNRSSSCPQQVMKQSLSNEDLMRTCNIEAGVKSLSGDLRRAFMSECVRAGGIR